MTIDINELRKVIADCYWPTSPVTIKELLDRLEAAERDVALKERVIDALGSELNAVAKERDALRAKIKQMEKQEPVGEIRRANSTGNYNNSVVWVPMVVGSKLYALPGAQGEEK